MAFPDIGYCQGTGVIVACLLLFMEEENAFWMMATIVEDLLPASYYSSTLLGIQADQRVMHTLIANYLSSVDESLRKHDIELSLITLHWFLTLCQRGAYEDSCAYLGLVLLRGLHRAVPVDSGHAQGEGARSKASRELSTDFQFTVRHSRRGY